MNRVEAILAAAAERQHRPQPEYTVKDSDRDGRPVVFHDGYDPLLAALIREHPERIPEIATSQGRVTF